MMEDDRSPVGVETRGTIGRRGEVRRVELVAARGQLVGVFEDARGDPLLHPFAPLAGVLRVAVEALFAERARVIELARRRILPLDALLELGFGVHTEGVET